MKLRLFLGLLIYLFLSCAIAQTNFTVYASEAEPTLCVRGDFSSTGDQWWKKIKLKLTNNCGRSVDLQNTTVTFVNRSALNTSCWGDFSPLPYPDNPLLISSQPNQPGNYLATFKLHFPVYPGSTTLLPANGSVYIQYGAPVDDFVAGSVNVYLGSESGNTGTIKFANLSSKPDDVTQSYVLVHVTLNGNKISDMSLRWNSTASLQDILTGTYDITADDINGTSGKTYKATVTPSSVILAAGQTTQVNISYNALR